MSFTPIESSEVVAGTPVAAPTQNKIKSNSDDHESRLQVIETSIGVPALVFNVQGYYSSSVSVLKTLIGVPLRITGVRIIIGTAGSAGITEIDIRRKRAGGAYTTIFGTLPKISWTEGDGAVSINGDLDPTMVELQDLDILRLDITSAQTDGKDFLVRVDCSIG